MPSVSVIMNVRNGAVFLREALDSVLGQTFADWELIAWDDCSTDNSSDIIAQYRDPRVRYFLSPEDTPLGKARENAIRRATGTWLAFLDQDDIWLPHKLERQMELAQEGVGLIYGRAVMFYPDGRQRDYDYAHEFTALPEGDIFQQLFTDACFIAMSSAVLRRSAVGEIGGIPAAITAIPDYYLYVAIARRYQARAVQQPVCRYRMHPGSMTHVNRRALHSEPLWLLQQWQESVDPSVARHRRMAYSTALAWEEMRSPGGRHLGAQRMLRDGSIPWLLSRPFVRSFRAVRRMFRRPRWKDSPLT